MTGRTARAALLAALLLALAPAGGCRERRAFRYDFEGPADLDAFVWNCRTLYRLSPEHATSGGSSLAVVFHPAPAGVDDSYPGLSLTGFDPDWTRFGTLVFDAHNPGDVTLGLRVRVDDRRDAAGDDWFWQVTPLAPGDNHVAIPLARLRTRGGRPLRLRDIQAVMFYLANPPNKRAIYLDNLRLE